MDQRETELNSPAVFDGSVPENMAHGRLSALRGEIEII
jgi:hypothetical protein